ncbi:DUF4952 domain-containing protein [archaeon]|nr:MAG: DUF4952 domain-containing protein [archaeon]
MARWRRRVRFVACRRAGTQQIHAARARYSVQGAKAGAQRRHLSRIRVCAR